MVQSGHWPREKVLGAADLQRLVVEAVGKLDIDQARREVEPFVRDPMALAHWSAPLFLEAARRIVPV